MVPGIFVALESLPLFPSGKLNRGALPEPVFDPAAEDFVAPSSPSEELLAAAWSEVLEISPISAAAHFFHLGGHSLLATQVASRIRASFGVELPLRTLFETPVLRELARRIDDALRAGAGVRLPPITADRRPERLPLSFAQQRLWFIEQLAPGSAAYNIPAAVSLQGDLAVDRLAAAVAEIVRRHEGLRTVFRSYRGEAAQVVLPSAPAGELSVLPVIDLEALGEAASQCADALILREATRGFDLAAGPLLRAALLRSCRRNHTLVVNMHHIVSDGWSVGILIRELSALYSAAVEGKPSPLAPLAVQYPDFALWQRRCLEGEVLQTQLAYWVEHLGGEAPAPLELPTDHPRPAVQTSRGRDRAFLFPPAISAALEDFASRSGATLFMILLSAYTLLLHRLTGRRDLVVGTPIANRNRREVEGLIGFFVNTLALRTEIEPAGSFRRLLEGVREATLAGFTHQDLPFERLVEALQPERDVSREPIFQVMFVQQNATDEALALPGLEARPMALDAGVAKVDLTLGAAEAEAGVAGFWNYNTDLFDATTIERLHGQLCALLEAALTQPDEALTHLDALSPVERQQFFQEWPGSALGHPYPRESTIHGLFEELAAELPGRPAMEFGDRRWSYGQLDAWASQLARQLVRAGIGVEARVGLLLERSPQLVASTLACLKVGAAYVPLDPAYPAERLAFLLEDASIGSVVAVEATAGSLAELPGPPPRVVMAGDGAEAGSEIGGGAPAAARPRVSPQQAAYVMYTSGSTGAPKGVVVTHRGVVRLVRDSNYFQLAAGERIGHLSNPSFDASTWEVWGTLLNGGCLVGIEKLVALSPAALAEFVRRRQLSTLLMTTALFNQIAQEDPTAFETLAGVMFGGEAADPVQVRRVLAGGRPRRLLNVYGPTENATLSTYEVIDEVPAAAVSVPIGRSVANTQAWVLGRDGRPVPVGARGELCLGGDGLARGYLGRPGLTAEHFVPAAGEAFGDRLYRTGDLVRWLPDGRLDFAGRIDHQVKLRGFRIEMGEVEAALSALEGVEQSLALVREDRPGIPRLVAYVVASGPAMADSSALRQALGEKLPAHMVPSSVVVLDTFPLTVNGKVDRKALPAPEGEATLEVSPPQTATEAALATAWSELLGVQEVGRESHFFDLGGHSLLATQAVSRVRKDLGVEVPLRTLFEAPRLDAFAGAIDLQRGAGGDDPASPPPLVPMGRPERLPLSFAQQRLWFIGQLEPGSPRYNMPTAVRLSGRLEEAAMVRSLSEILRRHEALRTTFREEGGKPWQAIRPPAPQQLPLVDLSDLGAAAEGIAAQLGRREALRPFDLATGPLLRTTLLRLDPQEHRILVTLHHIVGDGWSVGVFVAELSALYQALVSGQPPSLAPLPVQYADYAQWQRGWLQGEILERQVEFWRGQLGDSPPPLELPTDRPRPLRQSLAGGSRQLRLSRELTDRLEELAQQGGGTLFMVLMTAFQIFLSRLCGHRGISVGTPIANRTRGELEGLIGFFVNTLVLRTNIEAGESLWDLLRRVRRQTLAAYAHQDLPFERLVEELEPDRDLHRAPLFQVMMVLQKHSPGSPGAARVDGFSGGRSSRGQYLRPDF